MELGNLKLKEIELIFPRKKEAEFPNTTAVAMTAEKFTLGEEKCSMHYLILFLINYI